MMERLFPNLHAEVEVINRAYGFCGSLDALLYIQQHADEYAGTACGRQFADFCRWAAPMFKFTQECAE